MNLDKDKVIFGIIHTKEVKLNHPYNKTICIHTEYGNLYVQKRSKQDFSCSSSKSSCDFCCLEGVSCSFGACIMRFISKYKNVNMKTMKKLIVPIAKDMEEKYPSQNCKSWKTYFEERIEINLNRDDLKAVKEE